MAIVYTFYRGTSRVPLTVKIAVSAEQRTYASVCLKLCYSDKRMI